MKINKIFDLIENNTSNVNSSNKQIQFPIENSLKSVLNDLIRRESIHTKVYNRTDKENTIGNNQNGKKRKRPLKIKHIFNLLEYRTTKNNFNAENYTLSNQFATDSIKIERNQPQRLRCKLDTFVSNESTAYPKKI
jgi:hypothetical protein